MVRKYAASEGETFYAQPETRVGARPDFFIWIRHNPLKRPISAKEKQENASLFPCISLDFLARASRFGCIHDLRGPCSRRRPMQPPGLNLEQQAAGLLIDHPVAGGEDSAPLGGVLSVPGRHHAARSLDDRR